MLRANSRRRSEDGASYICIAVSVTVILLFVSFFVFHARLSSFSFHTGLSLPFPSKSETPFLFGDDDEKDSDPFDTAADDRIDVMDDEKISDDDGSDLDGRDLKYRENGYFWDHVMGVKRRNFGGRKGLDDVMEEEEEEGGGSLGKVAFSSDDMPVDEEIRVRLNSIRGVEDTLLVKMSGVGGGGRLREGWAKWHEEKGRFLRQDRMFASSLELFNPLKHPLLQDPDIPGGSVLTRGDKLLRKAMWKELEKVPIADSGVGRKRIERRALNLDKENGGRRRFRSGMREEDHVYPDGKRWGYYPGIEPELSFSKFMDKFLGNGQCSLRVFMVWNSPSWSYGVRHQRGLESLLHHHKDACVVLFSEMMELDFFADFVKDGYKIALAMPNLDDLLKDTPVSIFASIWNDWRKTKYYPIHYSELIRLAALYKYGGMYLDSDVIVLKPLSSAGNFIVMENKTFERPTPIINGAVMAFEKHSPFVMECLKEFYSSYDDTRVSWNGAELLTRVFRRHYSGKSNPDIKLNFTIHDPHVHFPISSQDITRYFNVASDDSERSQQEILFNDILDGSKTFHLWNSVTSALVPEPGSLVERLINRYCLFCLDVL